jgi:hypothetical protein
VCVATMAWTLGGYGRGDTVLGSANRSSSGGNLLFHGAAWMDVYIWKNSAWEQQHYSLDIDRASHIDWGEGDD